MSPRDSLPAPTAPDRLSIIQRVGIYALLALLMWLVFGILLRSLDTGALITAAFGSFGAGAVTNAIVVRIYEQGRLSDFGLGWTRDSSQELFMGFASGAGAGLAVMGFPLALGYAHFERVTPSTAHPVFAMLLIAIALFFGASGEEMLFRGYAFQVLARTMGAFATILPVAVVFGMAHMDNQNATLPGVFNTFAWGVLLGYARWRTGALWLPIGLHFGWNLMEPLFGANLSGFTISVTGYALHWSAGRLWSGGAYGPEGSLSTTAVVVALMWLITRAGRSGS